jgi:GT2 family glycosyltransferase
MSPASSKGLNRLLRFLPGIRRASALPRVSIVLPVYNGERYLATAIESILAQSYRDWELIVVDDGSIDASLGIARAYAAKDNRIRVHEQPNRRLPAALNAGFEFARGRYLTWTSADNRLLPDCLEVLVQDLESRPDCDMVYANMRMIDEEGQPLRDSDCIKPFQDPSDSSCVLYPDDTSCMEHQVRNAIGAAFLYRRCCAVLLGGYDERFFTAEDYDYWLRMRTHFKIRHVQAIAPVYEYRFHRSSLSARSAELGSVQIAEQVIARHRRRLASLRQTLRFRHGPSDAGGARPTEELKDWLGTSRGRTGGRVIEFFADANHGTPVCLVAIGHKPAEAGILVEIDRRAAEWEANDRRHFRVPDEPTAARIAELCARQIIADRAAENSVES